MPLDISCPSCQASYRVSDDKIGKHARCKKCGEKFEVSIVTNPNARPDLDQVAAFSGDDDFLARVKAQTDGRDPDELSGKFGRYEIVRVLGKGGMGAVYLAKDSALGRLVALKVPLRRFAHHPEVVERFAREARIGAAFQHPRFCPIHDIGRIDDRPFLSMAYIEGETLGEKLKREGRLSDKEAARIVREVALGLAEAHRRDIIHRDLKPSNIMIDVRGEPILMDFGLAKQSDSSDESLTATGSPIGTPHYMPPEQVRGDKQTIGPASDIYSLGVILYELLAGRRPFEGAMSHVFVQITTAPPEKLSALRSDVPPALEAACLRAMAKEPKDRHASMEAFAEALRPKPSKVSEPVRVEVLVHPPPGGSAELVRQPEDKGESKAWIAFSIAAAAVLLVGSLIGSWMNGEPGRDQGGSDVAQVANGDGPKPEKSPEVAPKAEPEPPKSEPKKEVATKPEPPKASPARGVAHQPLDVIENLLKMKLVLIPAGKFLRGSPETDKDADDDEKPQREITLTKSFWLGMHEVTQAEYRAAMQGVPGVNASPSLYKGDDRPVERVSWFDAVRFCNEVSRRESLPAYYRIEGEGEKPAVSVSDRAGLGYRLPTEAEWEYACRAGSRTRYHFGDDEKDLAKYAWFGNITQGTHPAGGKEANDFKLRDMHGNVWEWCEDWHEDSFYKITTFIDPINTRMKASRVIRGGSFSDDAGRLRTAGRRRYAPAVRYVNFGFRLSRTFR